MFCKKAPSQIFEIVKNKEGKFPSIPVLLVALSTSCLLAPFIVLCSASDSSFGSGSLKSQLNFKDYILITKLISVKVPLK